MRRSGLLLVMVLACKKPEAEAPEPARHVRCAESLQRPSTPTIVVRGTVAPLPDRDSQLAPQVSGRIASLDVREGDRVTKNQVIARIEMATLSDVVSQAEAAVSRAQAERKNAETTLERNQKVFDRGIAARQDLDDALSRAAAAKASEADAVAVSSQAKRQLDRALLRAPFDGVVVRLFRKPGELVDGTPATPVLEIADLSRLELAVDAPVQDVVRVAAGAAASVTFSALPESRFSAKVVVVSPSVDRTTGLGVIRLELTSDAGRGPPIGTMGVAHIEVGEVASVTWVPEHALRNVLGDEGEVVSCDGTARVIRVVPGEREAEWVEVTGLDAGVSLVVEHLLGLNDGDALEVDK